MDAANVRQTIWIGDSRRGSRGPWKTQARHGTVRVAPEGGADAEHLMCSPGTPEVEAIRRVALRRLRRVPSGASFVTPLSTRDRLHQYNASLATCWHRWNLCRSGEADYGDECLVAAPRAAFDKSLAAASDGPDTF